MSLSFIACVYVLTAIVMGGGLAWFAFKEYRTEIIPIVSAWLIITAIAFNISIPFLFFTAIGIVLYLIKPKVNKDKQLLFFMALMPALPMFIRWQLAIPGTSVRLFDLHYLDLLNLIYLLPFAASGRKRGPPPVPSGIFFADKFGRYSVYFVLYILFLGFRDTTLTNGFRQFVQGALELLIIVMAFRNLNCSKHTIDCALKGMLIAACMMGMIAVFQKITLWKFYTTLSYSVATFDTIYLATEIRGGTMRTPSTMYPVPFGLYMALCAGIMGSYLIKNKFDIFSAGVLAMCLLGLALSDSRGAMLGLICIWGLMCLFSRKLNAVRQLIFSMRWVLIIVTIGSISILFNIDSLTQMDEHGTFLYRVELIQNSMAVVRDNVLFGSERFRSHPALEASRQGQGIIDITNALLGMLLHYGAVGLLTFLYIFYALVKMMIKERAIASQAGNTGLDFEFRMLISLLIAYIIVIVTVSFVDRIEQYYWILIGLGLALIKNKECYVKESNDL